MAHADDRQRKMLSDQIWGENIFGGVALFFGEERGGGGKSPGKGVTHYCNFSVPKTLDISCIVIWEI